MVEQGERARRALACAGRDGTDAFGAWPSGWRHPTRRTAASRDDRARARARIATAAESAGLQFSLFRGLAG